MSVCRLRGLLYSVHVRTRKLRSSEGPLLPGSTRQPLCGFSRGQSIVPLHSDFDRLLAAVRRQNSVLLQGLDVLAQHDQPVKSLCRASKPRPLWEAWFSATMAIPPPRISATIWPRSRRVSVGIPAPLPPPWGEGPVQPTGEATLLKVDAV